MSVYMPTVSSDISMEELLQRHPEVATVLVKHKLYCIGCLLAKFHDLDDAAFEHGLDGNELYQEIIDVIHSKIDPEIDL